MKGSACENTQWATGLATKLRFLQSSLTDDVPEARDRVLNKELVKALKPVPPERRQECLEILAAQFPVPEPFSVRCELEEERRKLIAERDAAMVAIAEREAAICDLHGQYAAQIEEQKGAFAAERDATLGVVAERDAALRELQSQLDAHAEQIRALSEERDDLTRARHEDAARLAQVEHDYRSQLESGSGENREILLARDQALAKTEETRTRYEAQLATLKKERDAQLAALKQERDTQLAALTKERDTQLATSTKERDAQITKLRQERDAIVQERDAQRATLTQQRDAIAEERDTEAARITSLRADPEELVDCLLALIPTATNEQISTIVPRLQETGLFPVGGEPTALRIPQELRERIRKISPGRTLDPSRGLRALDILIEFTWNLDQLVWQVWKSVAPKSIIHVDAGPFGDVKKCLAPFITGDTEVSAEQVKQVVEKTRKLVAGLLASMGSVGQMCAGTIRDRLSPTEIKKLADNEPGVFESVEKKCWRKYNERFIQLNGPAIENEVLNDIRKYTEKLVLGADAANLEP